MRRSALVAAGLAGLLGLLAVVLGVRWGNSALFPPPPGSGITILVVSNGFHSGLVLPRPETAAAASRGGEGAVLSVATRFAHYDWIEVGWGEERFYRQVPTRASFEWQLGLRALFAFGNAAVMHVVGVSGDPRDMFAGADLVSVELSGAGFALLVAELDRSFARNAEGSAEPQGPGLYGPSLFYRATGTFNLFNLCNHWTARLLDVAGVPVSPLVATLPDGLVRDLEWRSHLQREPRALPATVRTQ